MIGELSIWRPGQGSALRAIYGTGRKKEGEEEGIIERRPRESIRHTPRGD